ncbi:MAG: hypothetical protein K2L98_00165, partial [Bacilli bacterium]|nr:hypothetical protein [Bacilli bacterium]
MIYYSQIEVARKRLYANEIHFRNFKDIERLEVKRIRDLISSEDKELFSTLPDHLHLGSKMTKYLAVMRYLGSTNTNDDLPTYDAKIIFLIEAIDPNLEMYKAYLEYPVILKSQIAAEENLAKKMALMQKLS